MPSSASSPVQKSPGLAAALSVLLPGVGQIYIGQVGAGIGYIIAAIIGYSLFVIPGLIVLVVSAIHAYQTAKSQNRTQEERNSTQQRSRAEELARQRQAEMEELKRQKSTVKTDKFVDRIEKLSKLHTHDVLSRQEYKERKKQAISELGRKKLDKDPEDFLFEVKDLKDHALDKEDFQQIKQRIL